MRHPALHQNQPQFNTVADPKSLSDEDLDRGLSARNACVLICLELGRRHIHQGCVIDSLDVDAGDVVLAEVFYYIMPS